MAAVAAISIYVTDLDQATKFYTEALGFTVKERIDGVLVELAHDGPALVLCLSDTPATRTYPGGVVLGFPTGDLKADAARLKQAGARFVHGAPEPFPAGEFMACFDPFGNALEMLSFNK